MPTPLIITSSLGILAFLLLFPALGPHPTVFWWQMAATNLILTLSALLTDRHLRTSLAHDLNCLATSKLRWWGLLSAAILYLVFWLGHEGLLWLCPDVTDLQIGRVYQLKNALPHWQIVLLITAVIGPGEEIFWRGYLQRNLVRYYGTRRGILLAVLLYSGVHITSANPLLILAALICGAFWAALYQWKNSLCITIISHVTWDLLVFLILPLR